MKDPFRTQLQPSGWYLPWVIVICFLLSPLTSTAQEAAPYSSIRQIKESPIAGHPVQLTATVTYASARWSVIFVQDEGDAIYVAAHWERNPLPDTLAPGTLLEIGGIVSGGELNPIIGEAACRVVGMGSVPEPLEMDLANHAYSKFDAHWVATEAVIKDMHYSGIHLFAAAESGGKEIWLHLPPIEDRAFCDALPGSRVRVTGSLGINLGQKGEILGPLMYLSSREQLEVLDKPSVRPNPEDLGLLGWSTSSPGALSGVEVRLSGQVTYVKQNDFFFVENRGRVAKVTSGSCQVLSPGEHVEVFALVVENWPGYVDVSASQVRKTHYTPLPPAYLVKSTEELFSRIADGKYFAVRGVVQTLSSQGIDHDLGMKDGNRDYRIHVVASPEELSLLRLNGGVEIQAAGVCDIDKDNGSFTLRLSSLDDIEVLNRPVSRSLRVAWLALGMVGVIAFGYATWARALKKRVAERTLALQEITARLRSTNEAANDAILVGSPDGIILEVNKRLGEMFGIKCSCGDSVLDLRERLLADCDFEEDVTDELRQLFDSKVTQALTLRLVRPARREIIAFSAPVLSEAGEAFGRLWTFVDRTEQAELQESLMQSQKMEAVGRLAGGIAHDFNNLLTGVIGNLAVAQLDDSKTLAECRAPLAAAEGAAYRASELVKQLLGFSRKTALEMHVCNVNEVVERLREMLLRSFDSTIELDLKLTHELWPTRLDGNHLEQVLLNLCLNARDAIEPQGHGAIRISTANVRDDDGAEYVEVRVEDTGDGMEEAVLAKIFEPFFTTKEQGKGTGLGLAMSYGIIRQLGGSIHCNSEQGIGTEFIIKLPRSVDDFEKRDAAPVPLATTAVDGAGHTVLFIDDEAYVRAVGEGILKHHGYKVVCANHGREGLDYLENHPDEVTLIITDLTMPVMCGKEFLRRAKEQFSTIPVIVSSGYTVDPDTFEEETACRPAAFVSKPFSMEEILRSVQSCLSHSIKQRIAA